MTSILHNARSNTTELTQLTHLYTVTDAAQVIPIIRYKEGDELTHTDEHPQCSDITCPCNANVVEGSLTASQNTEAQGMNTSDGCAWCGTGEGLCASHMQTIFAESEILAATGQYLADESEENAQPYRHAARRKKHALARAYVRLRRFHAQIKTQRFLRWKLKRAYQAKRMEVKS
jgi:hypothetical protein